MSDKLTGEQPDTRLHKLSCDEHHAHHAPKCCSSECWCRAGQPGRIYTTTYDGRTEVDADKLLDRQQALMAEVDKIISDNKVTGEQTGTISFHYTPQDKCSQCGQPLGGSRVIDGEGQYHGNCWLPIIEMKYNRFCRLRERVAELQAEILRHEEAEASICPEDIGIAELIKLLQRRIAELEDDLALQRQANRVNSDEYKQRIAALEAENATLRKLVTELEWGGTVPSPYDEGFVAGCPMCDSAQGNGHAPRCRLRAAIDAARRSPHA